MESGGADERLPDHIFHPVSGDKAMKCATKVAITHRREKELDSLGFIALVQKKSEGLAVFLGGQTVCEPAVYNTPED